MLFFLKQSWVNKCRWCQWAAGFAYASWPRRGNRENKTSMWRKVGR